MKNILLAMILMTATQAMATGGSDVGSAICTISTTKDSANGMQFYGNVAAVFEVNPSDNSNGTVIIRRDGKALRTGYNQFDGEEQKTFLNGSEGTFVSVITPGSSNNAYVVLMGTIHPGAEAPSFTYDLEASSHNGPVSLMNKAKGINVGCLAPKPL